MSPNCAAHAFGHASLAEQAVRLPRLEREAMQLGPELLQPQAQPAALEAGVAGEEDALAAPEIGIDAHAGQSHFFHGALAGLPQLLEQVLVAQGVHRLPEAGVLERHQLAAVGQVDQRLLLPDRRVVLELATARTLARARRSRR